MTDDTATDDTATDDTVTDDTVTDHTVTDDTLATGSIATPPGSSVTDAELDALRSAVAELEPRYLADLERLVNIDCGSYTKAGVDEVGRWVAGALQQIGATIETVPSTKLGDVVVGRCQGDQAGPVGLLIGHMDTVFEPGTATERPFRIDGGRALGPGVTDMKSGLLAGIYALRAIKATTELPFRRLVFVANPDEEIGSPVSSPIIRAEAGSADVALVLECARENGDIVSARKGIADLHITIEGRAAHAGVEPQKGRSAILEAAHKVLALHALNGQWPGVTVNVGVITGGTRPNVVAEHALLKVDIRAVTRETMEQVEREVRAIASNSSVSDVTAEVEEHGRHWPMEKLPRSGRLVEHAVTLAGRLGFELHDAATGGASDANTTAGMGIPTLDGLGPVGGNDHAPGEYLELDSIVPRTTLLAALILAVGRDPALR